MQQSESETDLIARYYTLHYDEVKAFVSSRIRHAEETEDLVQNVFLRLLRIGKMVSPTTLPCLVYTVARNLICDYWRHRQCVLEYEHEVCMCGKGASHDTESICSAREVNEILERGVAKLCEKQRKVYRMSFYEGMNVGEIAIKLDIKYKSAENRLGEARKQVRKYMRRMLA